MKHCVIIDIDGTLADIDHRRHCVEQKPKDWKQFNSLMVFDLPNPWCVKLIEQLHLRYDVILCSGRMERHRAITENWLKENKIHYHKLFMRKERDFRDDSIIKAEIYEKEIEPSWNVVFVVDDRKRVVDMWRNKGLTCLQCAEGDF